MYFPVDVSVSEYQMVPHATELKSWVGRCLTSRLVLLKWVAQLVSHQKLKLGWSAYVKYAHAISEQGIQNDRLILQPLTL
jgi:hypothetical protein